MSREYAAAQAEAQRLARDRGADEALEHGVRQARGAWRAEMIQAYRDPDAAMDAYDAHARERGTYDAVRVLREQPEKYGAMERDGVRRAGTAAGYAERAEETRARQLPPEQRQALDDQLRDATTRLSHLATELRYLDPQRYARQMQNVLEPERGMDR